MSKFDSSNSSRWRDGLIELQPQQLAQIAFVGAVTGAILWLFTLLIRHVIMVPLFCGDPASGACVGTVNTASIVATVLTAIAGLMGLVRMSVFRPLLIVTAAAICLWGLGGWLTHTPWYEALAWSIILYGLSYAAFAWLVRPRAFLPALIIVIAVVVLTRWTVSL